MIVKYLILLWIILFFYFLAQFSTVEVVKLLHTTYPDATLIDNENYKRNVIHSGIYNSTDSLMIDYLCSTFPDALQGFSQDRYVRTILHHLLYYFFFELSLKHTHTHTHTHTHKHTNTHTHTYTHTGWCHYMNCATNTFLTGFDPSRACAVSTHS